MPLWLFWITPKAVRCIESFAAEEDLIPMPDQVAPLKPLATNAFKDAREALISRSSPLRSSVPSRLYLLTTSKDLDRLIERANRTSERLIEMVC